MTMRDLLKPLLSAIHKRQKQFSAQTDSIIRLSSHSKIYQILWFDFIFVTVWLHNQSK